MSVYLPNHIGLKVDRTYKVGRLFLRRVRSRFFLLRRERGAGVVEVVVVFVLINMKLTDANFKLQASISREPYAIY